LEPGVMSRLDVDRARQPNPGIGRDLVVRQRPREDQARLIPAVPLAARHEPRLMLEREPHELQVMDGRVEATTEPEKRLEITRHDDRERPDRLPEPRNVEHIAASP